MSMNRRAVIKTLAATSSLVGLGVLIPGIVRAAWPEQAFAAQDQDAALEALLGETPEESLDVTIKVPDIVEDSRIVPVTVSTQLPDVESISLFVADSAQPLVAQFIIPQGTQAEVGTRIRLEKTTQITAVVKTTDRLLSASREVKLSKCSCNA